MGGSRRQVADIPTVGWVIEHETIERAKAGDGAAQRDLYEANVDRIYRVAFRLAGDEDLARDFTQESFIRAFHRIGVVRVDSPSSPRLEKAIPAACRVPRSPPAVTDAPEQPPAWR